MASPEVFHPQHEGQPPEIPHSGSLKSQLGKYVTPSETKIPPGKEWARILINKIPDNHKAMISAFIMETPFEDRQRAAQHLSELIEAMGDQLWRSRYPGVEIQKCMEETGRWLKVNKKDTIH